MKLSIAVAALITCATVAEAAKGQSNPKALKKVPSHAKAVNKAKSSAVAPKQITPKKSSAPKNAAPNKDATAGSSAASGGTKETKEKNTADKASTAAASAAAAGGAAGAALAPGEGVSAVNNPAPFTYGVPSINAAGVQSTGSNGPTNPKKPVLGTKVNQSSNSRLVSVNSATDWCTFGPPDNSEPIGNVEGETVAYCTQARNNARVIPDGTLTAVHFVKTPLYVQVMALGDFTKIGLQPDDDGGELDPHGAQGLGNPIGGNVTSNVSGKDVFYQEWMNYISHDQVCIRVCIAGSDAAPTAAECQHTLDIMGCNFVMPGNYADASFDSCEGDSAYPPGLYPQPDGSTSTFQQYFTGQYVGADGKMTGFTNGGKNQKTPAAAYSLPATSKCVPASSPTNGIKSLAVTLSPSAAVNIQNSDGSSSSTGYSGNAASGSTSSSSSAARTVVSISALAAALIAGALAL